VYWPPALAQLAWTSVCAWARGAAKIVAATAIPNVTTGRALNTGRFIFLRKRLLLQNY
jgi:hypothetical protein